MFKFVKDDVVQKLTLLQAYLDRESTTSRHFDTIQRAIEYETEQNLIKTNPENFTRTLLRLHRALIFIEEFLRGLSDRPASDSTVAIATNAYDSTLYYHREYHHLLVYRLENGQVCVEPKQSGITENVSPRESRISHASLFSYT